MLSKAKDGLRAKRKILSVSFSVGALAAVAAAQQPLVSMSSAPPQASSMGTQAVDVIPLRAYIGGTPLRHGNVVSGSERVDLNGRSLQSGSDYAMDYAAGVIYLKVTQKLGDSLLVSYNYDSKPGPSAAGSSFNGFQLNVLPGTSLIMGFGMAERQSDGNIVSSNVSAGATA